MSYNYTAAILTVSDQGFSGQLHDTSGPALRDILEKDGWNVISSTVVPNEFDQIRAELVRCSYVLGACLVLTTGGTGFSRRDVTPEATESVINRVVPGIPDAMRAAGLKNGYRAMLTRGVAGLRGETLIVNLPGGEKASTDGLGAILPGLKEGVDILRDNYDVPRSER
jgi:molybdopterin adenylyltransferase